MTLTVAFCGVVTTMVFPTTPAMSAWAAPASARDPTKAVNEVSVSLRSRPYCRPACRVQAWLAPRASTFQVSPTLRFTEGVQTGAVPAGGAGLVSV